MTAAFIWKRRVGFGDCDPAQIAYTGRIADFALEALDAFWDDLLDGKGWYDMNIRQGFGMPFVRMEFDFTAPVTPGPLLSCSVTPERVGSTSVAMQLEGTQDGSLCFRAKFVSVFADLAQRRKIPVPDDVRAMLARRYNLHADC